MSHSYSLITPLPSSSNTSRAETTRTDYRVYYEYCLTQRVMESYAGSNRAPESWRYYPAAMLGDFRALSMVERDERDQLGLNSLPESQPPFQLNRVSPWRTVLLAVILGSPRRRLSADEIHLVVHARFPYLSTDKNAFIIRQTLSDYREFIYNSMQRCWTVVSFGSAQQNTATKGKEKPLEHPVQKVPDGNPTHHDPYRDNRSMHIPLLPSCQGLIKDADTLHRMFTKKRAREPPSQSPYRLGDTPGYGGFVDMVNNDRVVDLETLSRQYGWGPDGNI